MTASRTTTRTPPPASWVSSSPIAGAIAGVLLLLAAPFVVIGGLKASRRRRRLEAERSADRISGGWNEIVDSAADYGTPVRPGATRLEDADAVTAAFSQPQVRRSRAGRMPRCSAPPSPSDADVEEFWRQVDEIVDEMGAEHILLGTPARAAQPAIAARRHPLRPPDAFRPRRREARRDRAGQEDGEPSDPVSVAAVPASMNARVGAYAIDIGDRRRDPADARLDAVGGGIRPAAMIGTPATSLQDLVPMLLLASCVGWALVYTAMQGGADRSASA